MQLSLKQFPKPPAPQNRKKQREFFLKYPDHPKALKNLERMDRADIMDKFHRKEITSRQAMEAIFANEIVYHNKRQLQGAQ